MAADFCDSSTGTFAGLNASLFQCSRTSVFIERPAAQVWTVLSDLRLETLRSWNPGLRQVKRISGDVQQQNEYVLLVKDDLVMLTKDAEASAQAPFFMRTVRAIAPHQRVLRIDAIDESFCGYVDHTLHEAEGRTTLVYSGYFETSKVPAERVHSFAYEAVSTTMMEYLRHTHELLRSLVHDTFPQINA